MPANEGYRRYVEAAAALGQITRARAEEIMRELMSGGDAQRAQAQERMDDLVERSRKAAESLVEMVRSEVANQMGALGLDPEDLARQAAEILRRSADAGRRVVRDVSQGRAGGRPPGTVRTAKATGAAGTAPAAAGRTRAPKKAAPKKAAPAKVAGKKAPAAKAPAGKKAPVAKAPAKKPSAAKSAATKQSAPKKAAAKRSAATTSSPAGSATAKKQGSGTTP